MNNFGEVLSRYRQIVGGFGSDVPYFTATEVRLLLMGLGVVDDRVTWFIWYDDDGNMFVRPSLDHMDEFYAAMMYYHAERRGMEEFKSRAAAQVTATVYDLYFFETEIALESVYGPLYDKDDKPSWIKKAWDLIQAKPELVTAKRWTNYDFYDKVLDPNDYDR